MVTSHLLNSGIFLQHWVCLHNNLLMFSETNLSLIVGEKLADDEVGELLNGHEDSQGNVNYEEFVRAVMSG